MMRVCETEHDGNAYCAYQYVCAARESNPLHHYMICITDEHYTVLSIKRQITYAF